MPGNIANPADQFDQLSLLLYKTWHKCLQYTGLPGIHFLLLAVHITSIVINIVTGRTQQTRGIHPMLFKCWASVKDGGPTLEQQWVNSPCLLGVHVHTDVASQISLNLPVKLTLISSAYYYTRLGINACSTQDFTRYSLPTSCFSHNKHCQKYCDWQNTADTRNSPNAV